jgi:membrane associated rhomboid family serine protease
MNDLNMHPLEAILTWCAEAAPSPWYPSTFSQVSGIPRERLDPFLDELRLGGLIRLTDWVQGRGQGYTLTPEGAAVVKNPRRLEKLRTNGVPPAPAPSVHRPPQARLSTGTWDRGEAVRDALLSPARPVVTQALLLVNVLVFLAGLAIAARRQMPLNQFVYGSDTGILDLTGAVSAPHILGGQWWRLLTSCFVHIGLLHLGLNMYGLYIIGPLVERMFGHGRYLLLYLVAGFCGNGIGILLQPGTPPHAGLLAGASGALCGILAAIAAWTYLNRHFLPPAIVSSWMRAIVINGVLVVFISMVPGVSWSAHLGGAAVGLLAAALLNYHRFGRGLLRWLALAGVFLLPVGCMVVLARAPSFDRRWAGFALGYYLSRVDPAERDAANVYSKALVPLLNQPPDQRREDEAAVTAALEELDQVRADLKSVAGLMAAAPTLPDPQEQEIMEAGQEAVDAWSAFFQQAERSLRKGEPWTDQDEAEMVRLGTEARDAQMRFRRLVPYR